MIEQLRQKRDQVIGKDNFPLPDFCPILKVEQCTQLTVLSELFSKR